jgi:hypothetical protein
METILLTWLSSYVGKSVVPSTSFAELCFDIFDEAVTVDFVEMQFGVNVNKQETWFVNVQELLDAITTGS